MPAKREYQISSKRLPELVWFDRAMAQEYLALSGRNRHEDRALILRIAKDIVNDLWEPMEAIIKLCEPDENGREELYDGQHRLKAVIEADKVRPGIRVPMLVGRGYPKQAKVIADSGKRRTFADVLVIEGYSNSGPLAAATKKIWWFQQPSWPDFLTTPTKVELLECLRKNPSIGQSVRWGYDISKKHLLSPSNGVFLHYLFWRVDNELADEFFEYLISGENLQKGNPIYALRERLNENATSVAKLPEKHLWALTIKGWNAYFAGETVRLIKWPSSGTEHFPKVSGLPIPLSNEIDQLQAA